MFSRLSIALGALLLLAAPAEAGDARPDEARPDLYASALRLGQTLGLATGVARACGTAEAELLVQRVELLRAGEQSLPTGGALLVGKAWSLSESLARRRPCPAADFQRKVQEASLRARRDFETARLVQGAFLPSDLVAAE